VKAVDGVSFSMQEGETIGIIGESGCGKTTLGRVLVNLEQATSGTVLYEGKTAKELLKKDRLGFHRMCQMVFQNPFDTFDSRQRISAILMDPLKLHKIGNSDDERLEIIKKALEDGGMTPASLYLNRFPHELSGGQLQRISIIRAMLLKPRFLIADEPVSMLDVSVRGEIIKMLQDLTQKEKTTLIFISHDIATTRYISDRIIVMYYGEIVETGETEKVLKDPQHDYTKLLISCVASVDPRKSKRRIQRDV
jgi:ATPase components of various ABC-type transport systems, contain duplicated ATPase